MFVPSIERLAEHRPDRSSSQDTPEETEETETPATRPSVLAALGEKINQSEPVKPFRSYYDKDGDAR